MLEMCLLVKFHNFFMIHVAHWMIIECISDLDWFGLVWFYDKSTIVGYWMPFNAKYCLYIYIKYISFGLIEFYGISTIVGYLMQNPPHTYTLNIFGWVLWHINHCWSLNAKYCLYIYIKYISFGLVEFYGIPTMLFKRNYLHTYIFGLYGIVDYVTPNVVYWPTTRPGSQNRKCTCVNNRCIRSRNIRI